MADLKERVGGRYFPNQVWVKPGVSTSSPSSSGHQKNYRPNIGRHNGLDQATSDKSTSKSKSWGWKQPHANGSPSKKPSLLQRMNPLVDENPPNSTMAPQPHENSNNSNPHRANGVHKHKPKVEEPDPTVPPSAPGIGKKQLDVFIEDFLNSVGESITQQQGPIVKLEAVEPDLSLNAPLPSGDVTMSSVRDYNHPHTPRGHPDHSKNPDSTTHPRKPAGNSAQQHARNISTSSASAHEPRSNERMPKIARRYPDDELTRTSARDILPNILIDNLRRRTEGHDRVPRLDDPKAGAPKLLPDSETITSFINILRDVGDELDSPPPLSLPIRRPPLDPPPQRPPVQNPRVPTQPKVEPDHITSVSNSASGVITGTRSPPRGPRAYRKPSDQNPAPPTSGPRQDPVQPGFKSPPPGSARSHNDGSRQPSPSPSDTKRSHPGPEKPSPATRATSPPRLPPCPVGSMYSDFIATRHQYDDEHRGRTSSMKHRHRPSSPHRGDSRETSHRKATHVQSTSTSATSGLSEATTHATSVSTSWTTPRDNRMGGRSSLSLDDKRDREPSHYKSERHSSFTDATGSASISAAKATSDRPRVASTSAAPNHDTDGFSEHKLRNHPDRAFNSELPRPPPIPYPLALELPAIMSPTYRTRYFERKDQERRRRLSRGEEDYDEEAYDEKTRTKWTLRDPYHPRYFYENKEERRMAAVHDMKRAQKKFGGQVGSATSASGPGPAPKSHPHRHQELLRPSSPRATAHDRHASDGMVVDAPRGHKQSLSLTGANAVAVSGDNGWGAKGSAGKNAAKANTSPSDQGNTKPVGAGASVASTSKVEPRDNAANGVNSPGSSKPNPAAAILENLSLLAQSISSIQASEIEEDQKPGLDLLQLLLQTSTKRKQGPVEENPPGGVAGGSVLSDTRTTKRIKLDSAHAPPPKGSYSQAIPIPRTDSPAEIPREDAIRGYRRDQSWNGYPERQDYGQRQQLPSSSTPYADERLGLAHRAAGHPASRDNQPRLRYRDSLDVDDDRRDHRVWEGQRRSTLDHGYEHISDGSRFHHAPSVSRWDREPVAAADPSYEDSSNLDDNLDSLACHRVPGIWFVQSMASDSLDILECTFEVDDATMNKWNLYTGRGSTTVAPAELFGARKLRLSICSFDRRDVDSTVLRLGLPREGEPAISPRDMYRVLEHLPQKWPSKGGLIVQMMPCQPLSGTPLSDSESAPLHTWLPNDFDHPHKPLFVEEFIGSGINTVRFISVPLRSTSAATQRPPSPPPAQYVFALRAFMETTPPAAYLAPILRPGVPAPLGHRSLEHQSRLLTPPPPDNGNESDDDLYESAQKGLAYRYDGDMDMDIVSPAPTATIKWL